MVKKMTVIIPARGGSKGLPKKNIKNFCGKPLIAWTIIAAQNSKYVDRVIVSTDCSEIAEVAKKYGAEIPFLRPTELATDNSPAIDAYIYTIEKLNQNLIKPIENFIVLQPTSPLRNSAHIDEAAKLFFDLKPDSLLSVYENPFMIQWVKLINENGFLKDLKKSKVQLNRQEESKTYLLNGAILILKLSLIKKKRKFISKKSLPFVMERKFSVDIDDEIDFYFAEKILEKIKKHNA